MSCASLVTSRWHRPSLRLTEIEVKLTSSRKTARTAETDNRVFFRFWPFCLFLLGFFLSFCFKQPLGLLFSKGRKRRKVYFGAIRNPLLLVQHVLVVTLEWIWRIVYLKISIHHFVVTYDLILVIPFYSLEHDAHSVFACSCCCRNDFRAAQVQELLHIIASC